MEDKEPQSVERAAQPAELTVEHVFALVQTRFPRGDDNWARAADLLVAEVRRLREELEIERGRHGHTEAMRALFFAECNQLKAELDRLRNGDGQ